MNAWLAIGCSNALLATALAMGVWAVTRVVRRAEVALVLWMLVLAKLLMPPLVSIPWESFSVAVLPLPMDGPVEPAELIPGQPDGIENVDAAMPVVSEQDAIPVIVLRRPEQHSRIEFVPIDDAVAWPWVSIFGGTWLAGSAIWFTLASIRILRFSRALRHAPPAGAELQREVRILANRLMLDRVPQVRLVSRPVPPLVWAMFGEATVLLPAELMARLNSDERTTLLAHELTHLKRRDHWLRWLSMAALGLYWWHPVAWWARRNVERAQEHCCDARVVELFPALARAYAEAMLATVDFLSAARPALPLGASGFSQAGLLKRRMEMVLEGRVSRRVSWPLRVALLSLGLVVLPLSIGALWADPAPVESREVAEQPVAESQDTAGKPDENKSAVAVEETGLEQRLDRLENMVEVLTHELRTYRTGTPRQSTVAQPAPPVESARTVARNSRASANEIDLGAFGDFVKTGDEEIDHEIFSILLQASSALDLSKTNLKRAIAVDRQLEAVKEAYEAETVTLDQLLEAVRRRVEAYMAFHRSVYDLEHHSVERDFLFARANLSVASKAVNESSHIWKQVHHLHTAGINGGEAQEEAQAREQYFQFKLTTQTLLREYQRAEKAMKTAQSPKRK